MELFELILILLACVMASAVADQFIPHLSLPLLQSLWGRINCGQETKMEQFRKAWHYHDEADANAMQIELDKIRECRLDGSISAHAAKALRDEVYLMQTAFLE